MFNYIIFKNVRGSDKLNVQLNKSINSLTEMTDKECNIINYMTHTNNYNFNLSVLANNNAPVINENCFVNNIEKMIVEG